MVETSLAKPARRIELRANLNDSQNADDAKLNAEAIPASLHVNSNKSENGNLFVQTQNTREPGKQRRKVTGQISDRGASPENGSKNNAAQPQQVGEHAAANLLLNVEREARQSESESRATILNGKFHQACGKLSAGIFAQ